jgi:hypothetical protein
MMVGRFGLAIPALAFTDLLLIHRFTSKCRPPLLRESGDVKGTIKGDDKKWRATPLGINQLHLIVARHGTAREDGKGPEGIRRNQTMLLAGA